jgi:hypothetical protein
VLLELELFFRKGSYVQHFNSIYLQLELVPWWEPFWPVQWRDLLIQSSLPMGNKPQTPQHFQMPPLHHPPQWMANPTKNHTTKTKHIILPFSTHLILRTVHLLLLTLGKSIFPVLVGWHVELSASILEFAASNFLGGYQRYCVSYTSAIAGAELSIVVMVVAGIPHTTTETFMTMFGVDAGFGAGVGVTAGRFATSFSSSLVDCDGPPSLSSPLELV